MIRMPLRVFGALLLAASFALAGEASKIKVGGVSYEVYRCRVDEVRLFWRGPDGAKIGQFSKLQEQLAKRGESLKFAMNAGIDEPETEARRASRSRKAASCCRLTAAPGKGIFIESRTACFASS